MSEPKEHPILFSGPMIRAILDGKKSMTRRIVKPPQTNPQLTYDDFLSFQPGQDPCVWWRHGWYSNSPYGWASEKLWVRESFSYYHDLDGLHPVYMADAQDHGGNPPPHDKWRPSIHMPRWASRITLEVTAVRVERVQDINDEDAEAEGIEWSGVGMVRSQFDGPRDAFECLWDAINGPRGYSWGSNPYVWVVSFKRLPTAPGTPG